MVDQSIVNSIRRYLSILNDHGIAVEKAVIFGSRATGRAHAWSDIDLLVIAPQFDAMPDRSRINLLWRLAARIDSRIEPIPCGARQWEEDDSSAIIEVARRHGEMLAA